jgi:hypothetical protein
MLEDNITQKAINSPIYLYNLTVQKIRRHKSFMLNFPCDNFFFYNYNRSKTERETKSLQDF